MNDRPSDRLEVNGTMFKIAETVAEKHGHFAVRHAVFVEEQHLFASTDVDEIDDHAFHLVAIESATGEVAGAVRVYRDHDDVWYGARLAVALTHRQSAASIGANLCRLAEQVVATRGCNTFLARVQVQNVIFFRRLRWTPLGEPFEYCGQPHQLMLASLACKAQVLAEAHQQT
ncbi:MAG: MSMEG_0567/Sll0786 family nitrogen starvation N-acetyltransferase [Anaerolineales bacterium]